MDEVNKAWLKGDLNFYFRYKRKILEKIIVGRCLNVGCGGHLIKDAVNIDENAENLPYKSDSYDTVILSDVIEHIKDWEKAMEEAIRVSKNRIIITVPAYMWLWSDYDKELGHYRRYVKKDFEKYLKKYKNIKYKISYLFGAIIPFIWARKFTSGETPNFPKFIDKIFYIASHIKFPFGSTILLEIKKNEY